MPSSERIIITGATGLIGRRLVGQLLGRGAQVVIFSRDPQQARVRLPGAADYVAWSASEEGPWTAAIEGADAVIHLAGASISGGLVGPRWTNEYKALIRDSRMIGTRGIVRAIAAAKRPPRVLLSASAIGYYGHRDATPLDESAAPGNDFVARVVTDWEAEAQPAAELGVRLVLARTGLVLDANEGMLPQIALPFRLFSGGPAQPGSQYYSWIHIADEVGLLLQALDDERFSGPINLTAPEPQTAREFCAILGRVMGSPSWLPVPALALRATLGEMADLVTTGQHVIPRKALALGYNFRFPTLGPALRDLLGKP